ncbi:DUF6443 domain-containing protein [Chitinophaga tropicalis]|uniref:DUF6443 domain-containing protein n=1 Tax=Chitinophaga tropicalis TaxID=2683588 RepID=A0A7K1U7B8_9BACT|nr:DUF6443 domain-containing protein [Chitinophaga tropicalis]MVT10247.1 hypothetical protein [Chitinophaga tropicalis]
MRKYSILVLLCFFVHYANAQNTPENTPKVNATPVAMPSAYSNTLINYVRTWEPSMPTSDVNVVISESRTLSEVKQATQYLDGLGRPLQTVQKGISPQGRDLVVPLVYDIYGREQYKYLPYVQQSDNNNDGRFKTNPFVAQKSFYQDNNLNPGVAGENVYYSQTEYEASPLNRVLKAYASGNSWALGGGNKPVTNQYLVNTAYDSVRIWKMATQVPTSTDIYAANQLYKNVSTDEAGNQVVEYKDKEGKVIMKKSQLAISPGTAHVGWLCTYYVYDDLGNLVFVIPPKAVQLIAGNWTIGTDVAAELCFSYQYDKRNRMVVKQVPGAGPVHMVYDVRDRLVFTQDVVQRSKSTPEWLVTFYDELNRPVMTAIYRSSSTRETLQQSMDTATSGGTITYNFPAQPDLYVSQYAGESQFIATNSINFSGRFDSGENATFDANIQPGGTSGSTTTIATNPLPGISSTDLTPLTYTYYDKYDYAGKLPFENSDISKPQAGSNPYAEALPGAPSTMTNGLVTGSKVRVLGTDQWLTTSSYYNDKGRTIQVVSENSVGGRDVVTSLYDFNGKVLSSYVSHRNPRSILTPEIKVLATNLYDAAGRLVQVKKKINEEAEQIVSANSYDELGQLKQKRLGITGGNTQLDTVTYTYNIRGWVSGINKAYVNNPGASFNWFGQELSYDQGFTTNQYNGNIAGIKWKAKGDGISRAYGYNYDKVNRLTVADFTQQNSGSTAWTKDKVDFSVSNLLYDANGNINSMTQKGMVGTGITTIDQLSYSYQDKSNKLLTVADPSSTATAKLGDFNKGTNTGNDYSYDVNGNLVSDQNKGISSIVYNHLNLPSQITITGKGVISYQYDAAGNKLKKTVTDNTVTPSKTTTTDYVSGFVYKQDTLEFTGHEEGRIRPVYKSGQPVHYAYDYFEKDHLGNIRVVLGTQTDTSVYAATMETAATEKENALFSNIDATRSALPSGYPADATTNLNAYVSRLNAVNGAKIGPSLVLRVMAGDTIQLGVKAFYKSTGTSTSNTTPDNMLAAIVSAFSGRDVSDGAHAATGSNSPIANNFTSSDYTALKTSDPSQNLSDKPKAYLNFALFDDQFQMVSENSGVRQVQGSPDELQTLSADKAVIRKSGFLYIYTSNESGEDVFFDNLVVVHNSGPLLEETHYYPFGLTMAGISSNALKGLTYPENRRKYNGNELQSKEFGDGAGLEWTDFNARTYDQQIGRFQQIDPWGEVGTQEMLTPYQFAYNNPVRYNDPDGKCPWCIPVVLPTVVEGLAALGAATGITAVIYKAADKLRDLDWSQLGAGSQTTFVPHITIPQSDVRRMQSTLEEARNELNDKAKDLETKSNQLERSRNSLEKNVKEHEQKLEDYKANPDAHDNKGILKDKTPEQRQQIIEGRAKSLEKQIAKNKGELNKAEAQLKQTKQQLQEVKQQIKNIDKRLNN